MKKIDDVKTQMIDNIDNLIARGEKLEQLSEQTAQLDQSAFQFKKTAKKVKNAFLARFVMLLALLFFIVLIVCILAIFIGCGFPYFTRCGGGSLPGAGGNGTLSYIPNKYSYR